MAQGGDPEGNGRGRIDASGPQGRIQLASVHARDARRSAFGQAWTPPTASSSSCFAPNATLDDKYTVYGRVIEGMDVVDKIAPGEPPAEPTKIVHAMSGRLEGARMRVDLFDFDLPAELIALRPAKPRDSARLLLVEGDEISDRAVLDLPNLLRPGDVLVFNDTRVIPAQLEGRRGEASIGATLHKREGPARLVGFRPQRKASSHRRPGRIWRRRHCLRC